MDKLSIKKFAIWARNELLKRVSTRAQWYGITEKGIEELGNKNALGKLLTESELTQKNALVNKIHRDGYQQAMEEAAYIWFNRFCALRFMEVNGYLPSGVRVFSDESGAFVPQILSEAIHLGGKIKDLDLPLVFKMKETNQTDDLYKYLLIAQCNDLKDSLPGVFAKIDDYSELLFPDFLLREESVIEQMVLMIPEDDWKDQVQIIGWLYQYYNTDLNAIVYDGNMSKARVPKELLPAATTIYTPDWAVQYMVQNSLGRFWAESHDARDLIKEWKYFLEEADQEPAVEAQLAEIRKQYADMKPEDIKCIDPCMGSGHILVYMFDVLVQIYASYGYNVREAAAMILQHNLYGLDIDDRAAQLAYFAVMMKARQYDRRILSRHIAPHIYAIADNALVDKFNIDCFCDDREDLKNAVRTILAEMNDAKEYGSILHVSPQDWDALYARYDALNDADKTHVAALMQMIRVAEVLSDKFDVVVTNPPYLGSSRFSALLDDYVKSNYADVKSDLSMVMYKHALDSFSKANGFVAFITTSSWLFLSSFEKLRAYQQKKCSITSLVDFGTELFEGKVGHNPITSWCARNVNLDYKMTAIRLVDYCYSNREQKEPEFFNAKNRYAAKQSNFSKIPGSPVAYWVGEAVYRAFDNPKLADVAKPRQGLATGDNDRFLRFWNEVSFNKIGFGFSNREDAKQSQLKWFPCNKGGGYRRWYGNNDYIVNWENDGEEIRNNCDDSGKQKSRPQNVDFYFKEGMTWSTLTAGLFSMRLSPNGFMFETKGSVCFPNNEEHINYLLGLMNTSLIMLMLSFLAPTMDYHEGPVGKTPIIIDESAKPRVDAIVRENLSLSRADWDAFEISWDFVKHPLL